MLTFIAITIIIMHMINIHNIITIMFVIIVTDTTNIIILYMIVLLLWLRL